MAQQDSVFKKESIPCVEWYLPTHERCVQTETYGRGVMGYGRGGDRSKIDRKGETGGIGYEESVYRRGIARFADGASAVGNVGQELFTPFRHLRTGRFAPKIDWQRSLFVVGFFHCTSDDTRLFPPP